MANKLPFVDVLQESKLHKRRHDLGSFEYSYKAEITNVYPLTKTEKLYQIQIINPERRRRFSFKPGQFVMLELPGIGEAPFSISSPPSRHGDIELCIRTAGNLTNFLFVGARDYNFSLTRRLNVDPFRSRVGNRVREAERQIQDFALRLRTITNTNQFELTLIAF